MYKKAMLLLIFAGIISIPNNLLYALNFTEQTGKIFQSNLKKIHTDLSTHCPDKQTVLQRGAKLIYIAPNQVETIKHKLAYLQNYTRWGWTEFKNVQPYKNYVAEFEQALDENGGISPQDFVRYVLPLYTTRMRKKYRFPFLFADITTNNNYYNALPANDPEKIAGAFWRLNKYLYKKDDHYKTILTSNGVLSFDGPIYGSRGNERAMFRHLWKEYGFQVIERSDDYQIVDVGWSR